MSFAGMEIEAVEALSKQLNQFADRLAAISTSVGRDVGNLNAIWRGPDAQRFVSEWSMHRANLQSAHDAVRAIGDSAAKNAQQQRGASDVGSGSGSAAPVAGPAPASAATAAPTDPSATGKPGQAGPGQLSAWDDKAYHDFESRSKYNSSVGYNTDANGAAQDNCTAWAQWRRDQLGLSSPGGNGAQMAGNAGGTTSTPPSLGALVSYSEGTNGHVQVIEQIYPDGSFRVSETNYNGSSAVRSVEKWHPLPDGTWRNDRGVVRDLVIAK